jgi:hypothetical protein
MLNKKTNDIADSDSYPIERTIKILLFPKTGGSCMEKHV